MAKRKASPSKRANSTSKRPQVAKNPQAPAESAASNGSVPVTNQSAEKVARLLPTGDELKSLYQRYTSGSAFDDHDKAFYFVLDVGGLNRAKQLLAHVEEVLSELEEIER